MRRKYKMTGCARFFFFLLFFVPIVLIGVSYYNGNNPVQQIKDLLNIESTEQTTNRPAEQDTDTRPDLNESGVTATAILETKLGVIQDRLDASEKENRELKKALTERNGLIRQLQQQLGNE